MQMYNTEHLQEKWGPILDYDGVDPIKDAHRRATTAILLENQEKELREEASFLSEQPTVNTNSGSSAGFSAGATAAGPVAGFDPVLISLIRRSMPNLVAYDLAGVQPMNGPTGLIFAMRSRFTNQSGTEALFNEADSAFSGQNEGFDLTSGFTATGASNVGLGTTAQSGSNPGLLNSTAAQTNATDYNVGQGMTTGDSEDLGTSGAVSYTHLTLPTKRIV